MRTYEQIYDEVFNDLKKIERIRIPLLIFKTLFYLCIQILFLIPIVFLLSTFLFQEALYKLLQTIYENDLLNVVIYSFIIFCFVLLPTFMIIYSNLKNSFEKKSKGLIPKILSAITPNFIYGKDNSILREMVVKSNLFPASLKSSLNPFYCKNYLAGNINEIEVKWYDIYFTKLKKISILFWFIPILNLFFISYYFIKPIFTKQSIDEIVDFQGLFMVANYNKKFKGTTVVIPDRFEKSFGFLANSFQKLSSKKGEFVYLENVDFEKEFVVYSSDQIEARIILSPRMMERIIQLNKKSRRTIMLSFVDGIIFSAIYRIGGFINFSLTRSIKKGNALRETYNNLKFCVDIIEDLQLDNNFSIK